MERKPVVREVDTSAIRNTVGRIRLNVAINSAFGLSRLATAVDTFDNELGDGFGTYSNKTLRVDF